MKHKHFDIKIYKLHKSTGYTYDTVYMGKERNA
jgi:hypothetical protein